MEKNFKERNFGVFKAIYRYAYYKLIIPIKREKREPEYIARGAAVGVFFGFTPMVWQMNFVLLFWLAAKYFKWNFSLPIGLALTWVSNTITNFPLLYLYYVTGQIILGRDSGSGYDTFLSYFSGGVWEGIKIIIKKWGGAIVLGSALYMVIGAVIAYIAAYKYAKYRIAHKEIKRQKKLNSANCSGE